jgi:hypothetical protein
LVNNNLKEYNMFKDVKIATDAEVFVQTKGGIISSVAGRLGCTKEDKLEFEGYRLQEDNVLAEFDIDTHEEYLPFNAQIEKALMGTAHFVQNNLDMYLTDIASHEYTREELESFDQTAFVFGCNPDYNIRNGRRNRMPRARQGLRTAGAHVHFGWDHMDGIKYDMPELQRRVGTMCDYMLGLESLILDPDTRRRDLYGKAGAVRLKEYGVEYRSLSNFWIFSADNRKWCFDGAKTAFSIANSVKYESVTSTIRHDAVQKVINNGDKASATSMLLELEEFKLCL